MANRIIVNLDTSKSQYNIYECKQNDDLILEASIFENGIEKDVTTKAITINCTRSDGTYVVQNTDITRDKNKITANLKRDFTRVDGLDKLEIVLLENEKQNTTFDFNILVKPSVLKTAVEESKDTVIILEELGNKIVEAGQVKEETEQLIATGGAATKGDIATVNSQLEQKLNKDGIITMANLGQDVKERITGGSVAVVGRNAVLTNNIVDNQVNQYKVDFINKDNNLLREEYLIFNKYVDTSTGRLMDSSTYVSTEFISVDESTKYTFNWYKEAPNNPGVYVIYYNSNDVLISNEFVSEFDFTTPKNCKKIRISFPNYDILKFQNNFLSKDTTKTSPKLKNEYLDESFLNNNFEDNFAKKNIEPLNCTFFDKVTNIKDSTQFQKNKTVNPANSNFESYNGRTVLGFYDVQYVDTINCNVDCLMFLYNDKKSILSSIIDGNIIESNTVVKIPHTTDINDNRFIVIVALTVDDVVLNSIIITPSKYKFDGINKYYLKDSMINGLSNLSYYKNKKITCFGDSITAQNQWQPYVQQYFDCTMINKGVGGTTVHNNGVREVIEGVERDSWMCSDDRINLIPTDSDVILCFGGANDWGYPSMEMGTTGDGNLIDSKFKNAYSLMLKKIINRCPNARIITMTPIGGRTSTANANEDKEYEYGGRVINDFSLAVQEVSQYFGIPCINIHGESGISTLNHTTYIADIIHPNSEGGKLIANAVINGMKRFEPIIF